MKLDNDYLYTCGIDDSLRQVDIKSNSYTDLQVKLNAQPRGMDFNSNVIVTATIKEVIQNIFNEQNNSISNMNILYDR
jgi:WD repeat-containing protein 1 (actin-interacting protein 1)